MSGNSVDGPGVFTPHGLDEHQLRRKERRDRREHRHDVEELEDRHRDASMTCPASIGRLAPEHHLLGTCDHGDRVDLEAAEPADRVDEVGGPRLRQQRAHHRQATRIGQAYRSHQFECRTPI